MSLETHKQTLLLEPCCDQKSLQILNLALEHQQDNNGKKFFMIKE